MKLNDFKELFNDTDWMLIRGNLAAYIRNFEYLKIEREVCDDGYYVYTDERRWKTGEWTQHCYNLDCLNGWLCGAVQAANKIMKTKVKGEN